MKFSLSVLGTASISLEAFMKKGRHRRYEEARALKQSNDSLDDLFDDNEDPCPECDALPGQDHKDWCLVDGNTLTVETSQEMFPS
jgi:hypothetical protein